MLEVIQSDFAQDANYKQVSCHAEIHNILKIFGLEVRRQHQSTKQLSYASIMLMITRKTAMPG